MYLLDVSYSILLPCTPVLVQIPTSSPTGVPTSAVSSLILYDMNAYEYMSKLILCIYYLSLLETLQPSNAPTSQPTSQPTDNPTKVGSTNVRRKLLNVSSYDLFHFQEPCIFQTCFSNMVILRYIQTTVQRFPQAVLLNSQQVRLLRYVWIDALLLNVVRCIVFNPFALYSCLGSDPHKQSHWRTHQCCK